MAKISIPKSRNEYLSTSRIIKTVLLCLIAYGIGSSSRDFESLTISTAEDLFSSSSSSFSSGSLTESPKSAPAASIVQTEPTPTATPALQSLNLIPNNQLSLHDYFSDSWLLNRENFLKVPISEIGIVEDACFAAIGKRRTHDHSKMFVDWTEFMVMHLSKWWNELGILNDSDSTMFQHTLSILQNYLDQVAATTMARKKKRSPLHPTIAVIAFAPYQSRTDESRGKELTAHSLAATIASLYQIGFGRVVVTGSKNESVQDRVYEAFRLLHKHLEKKEGTTELVVTKIGSMELQFIKITDESWLTTQWVKFNMPRAAVIGMQHALGGKFTEEQDTKAWLGSTRDASYWKYVYLTEPDTLLHTKPSLWKSLQKGLDEGISFFPHRLQPLPHEDNLPPVLDAKQKHVSETYAGRFLPSNVHPFSNVTTLEDSSHCCDGGPTWPGRSEEFGTQQRPCKGYWWWGCGFSNNYKVLDLTKEEVLQHHKRLVPYPMMKIKGGTGVVFGPTEMGRRCIPSKTTCPKPS